MASSSFEVVHPNSCCACSDRDPADKVPTYLYTNHDVPTIGDSFIYFNSKNLVMFFSKELTRWHGSITQGADDTMVIKFNHKLGHEDNPHPGLPGLTWPPRPFSKPRQPEMRSVGGPASALALIETLTRSSAPLRRRALISGPVTYRHLWRLKNKIAPPRFAASAATTREWGG